MQICFSSCPNDTFIFHALLHNRVDTEGLHFEVVIADINELNQIAIADRGDAVKISFAAYPLIKKCYRLLNAGSALGYGNGPLLVARAPQIHINQKSTIAIPGGHTTAALLVRKAFPQVQNYVPMLFSAIPMYVKSGNADAGTLIHESRFTYADSGLHLITDLGEWWQQRFNLPLPLGGIALKRTLPEDEQCSFARVLRRSVDYALKNPEASRAFVRQYSQEVGDSVINQHIRMFVNNYTQDLSSTGRKAVSALLEMMDCGSSQDCFFKNN